MKTLDEPLCESCLYWREYNLPTEMQEHPDYDGHCWLKGIMTLNVQECKEFNRYLTFKNGRLEIDEDA